MGKQGIGHMLVEEGRARDEIEGYSVWAVSRQQPFELCRSLRASSPDSAELWMECAISG